MRAHRSVDWRAFVALLLGMIAILVAASGVVLFISPRGRVAHWASWELIGFNKESWLALHLGGAAVMFLIVAIHVYFNWRPLLNHIRGRTKQFLHVQREVAMAAAVVVIIAGMAVWRVPPLGYLVDLRVDIRDNWENVPAMQETPPQGFGQFTLESFCNQKELSISHAVDLLKARGFVAAPDMTLREIANGKFVRPRDVVALLEGGDD